MQRSKIETFIGFAIRKGRAKLGVNASATAKKVYVFALCKTASENTAKGAVKLAKKYGAKLIVSTKKSIEEIVSKENCKVVAICDKDLAKAIIDNIGEDFIEYDLERLEQVNG